MLEILAHANRIKLPGAHHVATFAIPDDIATSTIDAGDAEGWDDPGSDVARAIGDAWLDKGETAVLIVPSAIARPYENNVVINPAHADFTRLRMSSPVLITWDERLFTL